MINKHMELLRNRTSCRKYLDKKIEKEKIDILKETINLSPTSNNLHSFSCIFITDDKIKKEFKTHSLYQDHIASAPLVILFIADNNRTRKAAEKQGFDYPEYLGTELYTTSLIDAGIAAGLLQTTILNLGLDACWIAVLRRYPKYIIEKLNLPNTSVPIFAITVGYKDEKNEIKPKLNKVYDEKYNNKLFEDELNKYSTIMKAYYETRTSNQKSTTWFEDCAMNYLAHDPNYDEYKELVKSIFRL